MAVSGKTATYQLPYFLGTDKPPDMAAGTKAISERVEALLAKGGDVSIAADGTTTIAKRMISGSVTEAGAVGIGTGFSVERSATGVYKVTLSVELATAATMVAILHGVTGFIQVEGTSKKVFEIRITNTSLAAANAAFGFQIKAS